MTFEIVCYVVLLYWGLARKVLVPVAIAAAAETVVHENLMI